MAQWGFYFDQSRCTGCRACEFACKNWNDRKRGDRNVTPSESVYTWPDEGAAAEKSLFVDKDGHTNFKEYRKYYMKERWRRVSHHEYGYVKTDNKGVYIPNFDVLNLSVSCNHCVDPACLKACPMGAYYKEPQYGAVLVSRDSCISCGKCKQACPWGAPQFYENPENFASDDPSRPKATKCTLCIERLAQGLRPACVAGCMMRALDAGPIDELKARYPGSIDKLEEFTVPDSGLGVNTKPNIIFKKRAKKATV